MAATKSTRGRKSNDIVEKRDEKPISYEWVPANSEGDCGCFDDTESVKTLTFVIPGTKRDGINLRVIKDGMRLRAKRDDGVMYYSDYDFPCPADPDQTKAHYDEGMLRVDIPMNCEDMFKDVSPLNID